MPLALLANLLTGSVVACGQATPNALRVFLAPAYPGVHLAAAFNLSADATLVVGWGCGAAIYALLLSFLYGAYAKWSLAGKS